MNEILDEEEAKKGKEIIDKRVKNPIKTGISYLITMLCGFFACGYYRIITKVFEDGHFNINSAIVEMLSYTLFFLFLGFAIETLSSFVKKFVSKKDERVVLYLNPFWFRMIERAFGMSITLFILVIISKALGYS